MPTSHHVAGILTLMLGLFLFALQDLAIKHFSDHYSVLQIVWLRSAVAIAVMLVTVVWTRGPWAEVPRPTTVIGAISLFASTACVFRHEYRLSKQPLSDQPNDSSAVAAAHKYFSPKFTR